MARPALRLIHSTDSADDLMFRANQSLATGYPKIALSLYTRILYDVCPGHICAFLNRALAYIVLGYPELGVVDAYRAAVIAHDMSVSCVCNNPSILKQSKEAIALKVIAKYVRAERLHCQNKDPWTFAPDCYTGLGWLSYPLASIVLTSAGDIRVKAGVPWVGFELRAIYRMCGALWQCGGGALSDALGMLDDVQAKGRYPQTFAMDEKGSFDSLGNLIMADLSSRFSVDSTRIKAQMKMKVTLVNKVIYPWNTHEPDMNSFEKVEELEYYADDAAKACTVRSIPPIRNSGASLKLVAVRDIYEYETVLSEGGLLQVMTKSPANAKGWLCDVCAAVMVTSEEARTELFSKTNENWSVQGSVRSRSLSPGEIDESITEKVPVAVEDSIKSLPNQKPLEATENHGNEKPSEGPDFSFFSSSTQEELSQNPRSSSPKVPTSSHSEKSDQHTDFYCCKHCFEAPFCSIECLLKSEDYHDRLCMTGLEEEIRSSCRYAMEALSRSTDNEASHELFIHPKTRCLYDLLLVRILAMSSYKAENPLNLKEIRWLNGDLRPCSVTDGELGSKSRMRKDLQLYPFQPSDPRLPNLKLLPWTFTNNVLRPIQYMKEIGFDRQYVHLRSYDGWIINTLYAKIMHSMCVTKGVRHAKVYDELGKLVVEPTARAQNVVDQDVWVGSLHPIFSMIGIADETKGEKANVSVTDGAMMKCYPLPRDGNRDGDGISGDDEDIAMEIDDSDEEVMAMRLSPEDKKRPCIRAGVAILRAK